MHTQLFLPGFKLFKSFHMRFLSVVFICAPLKKDDVTYFCEPIRIQQKPQNIMTFVGLFVYVTRLLSIKSDQSVHSTDVGRFSDN